jgi:hypothetical protein
MRFFRVPFLRYLIPHTYSSADYTCMISIDVALILSSAFLIIIANRRGWSSKKIFIFMLIYFLIDLALVIILIHPVAADTVMVRID